MYKQPLKPKLVASTSKPSAKNKPSIVLLTTIFTLVPLLIFSIGINVLLIREREGHSKLPIFNFSYKQEILNLVKQDSIYDLPQEEIQEKALAKGLVASLEDPYSQYLTKEEEEEFKDSLNQKYEGIGVRFEFKDQVMVKEVFENSPAERSGIQAGDQLLNIDGVEVSILSNREVAEKIKGQQGTTVVLKILRQNQKINIEVERGKIDLKLIELKVREDVGIIVISSFGQDMNQQMLKITKEILNNPKIKKIVVDLRGNGGGLLNESLEIASYFVKTNSLYVTQKGKVSGREVSQELRTVTKKFNLTGYPMAVLIDQATASASEILAATLQYHQQAKLVGSHTYGKGLVQKVHPLKNGDYLKLSWAKWLTPKGQEIKEGGILADVKVKRGQNALDVVLSKNFVW